MVPFTPLLHDYAGDTREPEAADIRDALTATDSAIRRSMARICKAEEFMRSCDAALLASRQTVERARQLLAPPPRT